MKWWEWLRAAASATGEFVGENGMSLKHASTDGPTEMRDWLLCERARELHGSKLCVSVVSWAEKGRGAVCGARRNAAARRSQAQGSLRFVRERRWRTLSSPVAVALLLDRGPGPGLF